MAATPLSERGYARPELLAETEWLEENLKNPAVRIIDTRQAALYDAGHIPGAMSLSAAGSVPRAENGDMGEPEAFAELAGNLGVSNDATVVIYDAPGAAMGTLAWSFLYYGHKSVKMLDGGFAKWSSEGRAVATEPSRYPLADFEPEIVEEIYCSLDHAKAAFGQPDTIFWDTRTIGEYEGIAPTGANAPPRLGHLPGAAFLEWVELLDPESRTVKPAAELRALLDSRGITPESEINCY